MAATDTTRQLHDARQLKRLRELRERTALTALRTAEREVRAAEDALQQRQQLMQRLQGARDQLTQRIVHECAPRLGRLAGYASAAQEDLDDQLERTEYALIDDEEALTEAQQAAEAARRAWLRAVSQSGAADTLVNDARRGLLREREARLEREDAPLPARMA